MSPRRKVIKKGDPEPLEAADIEIGAAAKAKEIRFHEKPEVDVDVHGETRERDRRADVETASGSVRENLPEEVEPGVTYRNVKIGWQAAARIRDPAEEEPDEKD